MAGPDPIQGIAAEPIREAALALVLVLVRGFDIDTPYDHPARVGSGA